MRFPISEAEFNQYRFALQVRFGLAENFAQLLCERFYQINPSLEAVNTLLTENFSVCAEMIYDFRQDQTLDFLALSCDHYEQAKKFLTKLYDALPEGKLKKDFFKSRFKPILQDNLELLQKITTWSKQVVLARERRENALDVLAPYDPKRHRARDAVIHPHRQETSSNLWQERRRRETSTAAEEKPFTNKP